MVGPAGGNRGGDGRRGKRFRQRHAPPRRPSPLSSPHLRRTIPRNAAALSGISSRCATYDLRLATLAFFGNRISHAGGDGVPVMTYSATVSRRERAWLRGTRHPRREGCRARASLPTLRSLRSLVRGYWDYVPLGHSLCGKSTYSRLSAPPSQPIGLRGSVGDMQVNVVRRNPGRG